MSFDFVNAIYHTPIMSPEKKIQDFFPNLISQPLSWIFLIPSGLKKKVIKSRLSRRRRRGRHTFFFFPQILAIPLTSKDSLRKKRPQKFQKKLKKKIRHTTIAYFSLTKYHQSYRATTTCTWIIDASPLVPWIFHDTDLMLFRGLPWTSPFTYASNIRC